MKRTKRAQAGVFAYESGSVEAWGIAYVDPCGRRLRKLGFRTKSGAIAAKQRLEATGDSWVENEPPRFDVAIGEYLKHRKQAGSLDSSYNYLSLWKDTLADRELGKVSPKLVKSLLDGWHVGRKWSPAARNRALAQLSGAFSWFLERGWVDRHPVRGRIAKLPEDNARERWLRLDEIEAIREQSPPWLADIIQVAVTTGMRLGEICGLTRSSYLEVDDDRAFLVTQKTKNGDPLHWPLAGWLLDDVRRRADGLPFPGSFLYPGPGVLRKGGIRTAGGNARSSIKRALPEAVMKAELTWGRDSADGITFHTFRHSMASLGLNDGLSTRQLMALGNWRDRRMLDRYAHLADESAVSGAERLVRLTQSDGPTLDQPKAKARRTSSPAAKKR